MSKLPLDINPVYNALGNDSRYFIVTGGRGSGKSFAVNTFLAALTMERGQKILFTRFTMVSAATSIIPEFMEKIDLLGLQEHFHISKDEIVNTLTGSSIIFKGIKTSAGTQTANLKSLQGISCWVLDEAEELVNEDIFDKIDQSVRVKNKQNRVVLVLNPATKEHFIYQRFYAAKGVNAGWNGWKDNVTYIHTTYKDNVNSKGESNLSESFLAQLADIRRRRPDKYNHQILGGWLDKAEGVVYENWTIAPYNNAVEYLYGMDIGFASDPTCLVQVGIDVGRKKLWVREVYGKVGMSTEDIGELNRRYAKDNLIIADNSEPRLLRALQHYCNIKPTIKRQGSILTGIALLQDHDIMVDPSSVEIIKELNNYVWHERNKKPVPNWDHRLDAIRYAVQYFLSKAKKGKYTIR